MQSTFIMRADKIDKRFFGAVKKFFGKQEVEITIRPKLSETQYLVSVEANKKHLLRSIKQLTNGQKHTISEDEL